MGIIERARHVIRADLNQLLKKSRNPRLVLEGYLEDLQDILTQARSIRDAERTERDLLASRLRDLREAMRTMEGKARACLEAGDEELARAAVERKLDIAEQAEDLAREVEQRQLGLQAIEDSVETLKQRIDETNRRRRELAFRQQVLEARSELQQAVSRSQAVNQEPIISDATERLVELEGRLDAREMVGDEAGDNPYLRLEAGARRRRRKQAVERELRRLRQPGPAQRAGVKKP